jgi:hypothetical protein
MLLKREIKKIAERGQELWDIKGGFYGEYGYSRVRLADDVLERNIILVTRRLCGNGQAALGSSSTASYQLLAEAAQTTINSIYIPILNKGCVPLLAFLFLERDGVYPLTSNTLRY